MVKTVNAVADGTVIDFKDGVKENTGNNGVAAVVAATGFKINNGMETVCYHAYSRFVNQNLMKKGAMVKKGEPSGLLGK